MKKVSSLKLSLYLSLGGFFGFISFLLFLFPFQFGGEGFFARFVFDLLLLPSSVLCKLTTSVFCSEDHFIATLMITYIVIGMLFGLLVLKMQKHNLKEIRKKIVGVFSGLLAIILLISMSLSYQFGRMAEICVFFDSGPPRPCINLSIDQTKELIKKIEALPIAGDGTLLGERNPLMGYWGITGSLPFGSLPGTDKSPTYLRMSRGLLLYYSDNKVLDRSMQYLDKPNPNYIYKKDEYRKLEKWLIGLMKLDESLTKEIKF